MLNMGEIKSLKSFPLDFIRVKNESGTEDVHFSAFYEGVPDEFRHVAKQELNETEENKRNGFRKLKAFAKKEGLSCTEEDMTVVLRCCKYNFKKSEQKLKRYLKFRERTLRLVANLDEEKTDLILDDINFGVLPYRDKHGRFILFTRPTFRLHLYDMDDVDPVAFAFALYMQTFPLTTLAGGCYIAECATDNLYIYYPILKKFKKTYLHTFLDLPIRAGSAAILNENFLVRWFCTIAKSILPEKWGKRITLYGSNLERLKKLYHPDILPEDFGGNLGPITNEHFRDRLMKFIYKLRQEGQNL